MPNGKNSQIGPPNGYVIQSGPAVGPPPGYTLAPVPGQARNAAAQAAPPSLWKQAPPGVGSQDVEAVRNMLEPLRWRANAAAMNPENPWYKRSAAWLGGGAVGTGEAATNMVGGIEDMLQGYLFHPKGVAPTSTAQLASEALYGLGSIPKALGKQAFGVARHPVYAMQDPAQIANLVTNALVSKDLAKAPLDMMRGGRSALARIGALGKTAKGSQEVADVTGNLNISRRNALSNRIGRRATGASQGVKDYLSRGANAQESSVAGSWGKLANADAEQPVATLSPRHLEGKLGEIDSRYQNQGGATLDKIEKAVRDAQTRRIGPNEFVDTGEGLNLSQTKALRTTVGRIASQARTPVERAIANGAYDYISNAMKSRADDLDLSREFSSYNDIASKLHGLRKGWLGKLETAETPEKLSLLIDRYGPQIEKYVQELQEDYGLDPKAFGQESETLRQAVNSRARLAREDIGGLFDAILRRPVTSTVLYGASQHLPILSKLPWVARTYGVAEVARALDVLKELGLPDTEIARMTGKLPGNLTSSPETPVEQPEPEGPASSGGQPQPRAVSEEPTNTVPEAKKAWSSHRREEAANKPPATPEQITQTLHEENAYWNARLKSGMGSDAERAQVEEMIRQNNAMLDHLERGMPEVEVEKESPAQQRVRKISAALRRARAIRAASHAERPPNI